MGNVAFELAYPIGLVDKSDDPYFDLEQEYIDSLGNTLRPELARNISEFLITHVFNVEFEKNTTYESIGEYAEKMYSFHIIQYNLSSNILY